MSDETIPKQSTKIASCDCSYHPYYVHCWPVCEEHSISRNPNSMCGRYPAHWINIRDGFANGHIVDENDLVCQVCRVKLSVTSQKKEGSIE